MEYRKPKYNSNGTIDCEINHPEYGWIPFTAHPEDTGAEFDVAALVAEIVSDNSVTAYVAPDPVEVLAIARENATLTLREFCIALTRDGVLTTAEAIDAARGLWPTPMATFLDYLTPEQAAEVQIEWAAAGSIERMHPFVLTLASWLDLSDEQVDTLFGIEPTVP